MSEVESEILAQSRKEISLKNALRGKLSLAGRREKGVISFGINGDRIMPLEEGKQVFAR